MSDEIYNAFMEGFEAGQEGRQTNDNPYLGKSLFDAWMKGYFRAVEKRRG